MITTPPQGYKISTHAPHARRDYAKTLCDVSHYVFLLTRLMRGATFSIRLLLAPYSSFLLTRLMRGATITPFCITKHCLISTHAPHARRDNWLQKNTMPSLHFYSRASCEARRQCRNGAILFDHFYSRASCEARHLIYGNDLVFINFYSRASCEARRKITVTPAQGTTFLLTRLMRGATLPEYQLKRNPPISTHAPHARRDVYIHAIAEPGEFLLTRLMRGATKPWAIEDLLELISTHAPHARRDFTMDRHVHVGFHFYSRASCEARRDKQLHWRHTDNFYSRASCEARPGFSHPHDFKKQFLLTRLMRGAT